MSRTGAQLLVAGLEAAGVDVVFGLPGVHNLAAWEALREEDYVSAAQVMGASSRRIVFRHLVPGFASHLIATATIVPAARSCAPGSRATGRCPTATTSARASSRR